MFHLPVDDHNFSLRLSEVLDNIGVNKRMIMKWRRSTLLCEKIDTVICGNSVYKFGSRSEGTTTLGLASDSDQLFCAPIFNVIQDYSEWKHGITNLMVIQDDIISPGYCHLQLIRPDKPLPCTVIINKHCFRDANDRILLMNTCMRQACPTGCTNDGPAFTIKRKYNYVGIDFVAAFHCQSWPYEAREWLNRHLGRWPTADMKRYAESNGFFVVAVGSKVSQMEQLEWRISTSMAERCLMFNLNITQLRCYVLLKMILKTYLQHPVSSYMCKTVLLHCIEKSHPDKWMENNLFKCLSHCLQVLFSSLLHRSCPHYFIPMNNLMARQFSPSVKNKLIKRLRYVIESQGRALLMIQIDDLGQRLQIKMNTMYLTVQNMQLRSSTDICVQISGQLQKEIGDYITFFTNMLLMKTSNHSQSYETLLQQLMQTVFNFIRCYREGTDLEQTTIGLLAPSLCSILGSVVASVNIGTNNPVSPVALTWLTAGQTSDLSSGRLKLASVFYCAGDILRTELILRETERLYCLDSLEPMCGCYDVAIERVRVEYCRAYYNQNEKAIKSVCAFCIGFTLAEINCIPREMQYEMFRSTEDDRQKRHEFFDYWMNFAVVDSLSFLYFLQYKTYSYLHRYNDQQRALSNLVRTIITERNLGHRETALNLLGQCMEQENRLNDAFTCYRDSLNVRERNNVARFHICRLLAHMLNLVPFNQN